MGHEEREMLDKIRELNIERSEAAMDHWVSYSNMGTWQFWVVAAALLTPLVILLLRLDRRRTFQILFFGFTIHVLMNYTDAYAVYNGSVAHPYHIFPALPINLAINTSMIPVLFMLTYQYCLNRGRNVYLFGLLATAISSFGIGGAAVASGFLELYKGTAIWHYWVSDYIQFVLAYWLTSFFLKIRKQDPYVHARHG